MIPYHCDFNEILGTFANAPSIGTAPGTRGHGTEKVNRAKNGPVLSIGGSQAIEASFDLLIRQACERRLEREATG